MKKVVIVEGLDNTGKTTLINGISDFYSKKGFNVGVIHMHKPEISGDETISEIALMQDKMFMQTATAVCYIDYDIVIFDRAWYGEYVYGQLYRGRRDEDGIKATITTCEKIISLDGNDGRLITLYADNTDFLIANEDGKSLSGGDPEKMTKEMALFKEAFDHSSLDKKMIKVNVSNKFREKQSILSEAISFIDNMN